MGFSRISRSRLSEAAVEQIREHILGRGLEPGSKLPSERELVRMLGISRTSLREALRMLEIMGLVEVKPGKGAYVKALSADLFVPLTNWLPAHQETLRNHFEARLVLEPAAARLASQRAKRDDLAKMISALHSFQMSFSEKDLVGMIEADIQFHGAIAAATANRTLKFLMDTMTRFLLEGWKATLRVEGRPRETAREHQAIYEAIKHRDMESAGKAMEAHLRNAVAQLEALGL